MRGLLEVSILGVTLITACNGSSDPIITYYEYGIDEEYFDFETHFNLDVDLGTDLQVPIEEYGEVRLEAPLEGSGLVLGGSINMELIDDEDIVDLEETETLPNGKKFSEYVETPLLRLRIEASDPADLSFYLGLVPEYFYLGVAVELAFVDEKFPPGLVIRQRIRDKMQQNIGEIAFYGPKISANGELEEPGGIFFITNVSEIIENHGNAGIFSYKPMGRRGKGQGLHNDGQLLVNHQYREEFINKPRKAYDAVKLLKKRGQQAGLFE